MALKIKKDDNVIVISGKDRGKKSKVLRVLPKSDKLVVEGVGVVNRRRKPKKQGEKGGTFKVSMPVHMSNIALYCSKCKKGARIGAEGAGKDKDRVCTRCRSKI